MKRILYFLASVACVLAGCTAEPAESPLSSSDAPVFKAYYSEGGQTRTTLDENQTSILWSAGDAISVFDKDNTNHKYVASAAGKQCDFTLDGGGAVAAPDTWFAIYPYDAKTTFNGKAFKFTLPDAYTLTQPGTFADGMNVAVASSTTLDLPFRNVLAWIPVAIKGADHVSRIRFTGNANEAVSGIFSVDLDNLAVKAVAPGEKVMVLNIENFQESTSRENAAWYYIPVVPGTFGKGFSIIVSKRDGDYTFKYEKSATFERGQKRALFIEIPGGDDKYIPLAALTDGKVLQWTTFPHQDVNGDWTNYGTLYPDTHADIAKAQWEWDPEGAVYPTSATYGDKHTPIFTDGIYKEKDYNLIHGPWKDHALVFTIPVSSIPAGKSIGIAFKLQGGRWIPKGWTVEINLDGTNWATMSVTGADPTYINQTLQEKDSTDGEAYSLIAPFIFTKQNATPQIEASFNLNTDLTKKVVQIRIRALTYLRTGAQVDSEPSYAFAPQFNYSNSYTILYFFPIDSVHPGPYVFVR